MSHTRFLHLFLMGQENCVSCAFRTHNLQSSPDLMQASGASGQRIAVKLLLLLLLFFRLKSTCSLRLWCFTHHATSSFGISIMVGFVYLLLAYLHVISLLILFLFFMLR